MKTPINAGQTSFRLGLSAMFVGPEKAKTRLREVREMVREYKEHNNPDAPQLLSYAEDYVVDGILQRIDAMIAAIEEVER